MVNYYLKKEWYQRENASPFSIEYKACVEIIWNDPSFDPSNPESDKSMEKKETQRSQKDTVSALMALNLSLSPNALKNQIFFPVITEMFLHSLQEVVDNPLTGPEA